MERDETREILIVGGGICGLATALALHRKGIKSLVLEKSETLRATGAAIIVQPNGWLALEQLGVASTLRATSVPIESGQFISLDNGKRKEIPLGKGETRCLKRTDLMKVLADNLPANTIRLNCQVLSVKFDPQGSYPILRLQDGRLLGAKLVIGCDGVNSCVAKAVGLKSTGTFTTSVIRGFTHYGGGHGFRNEFLVMAKDQVQLGRMPINHNLVYWFLTRKWTAADPIASKDPELIGCSAAESVTGSPEEMLNMIKSCELDSLHLTDLRYRSPIDLIFKQLRRETVTVAGDAMHAMAPFLAQGGSASLEDAVVLARSIAQNICSHPLEINTRMSIRNALQQYVKERRMRVAKLAIETLLIGTLLDASTSVVGKILCIFAMRLLFRDPVGHTNYDCGIL